jgi:hypothetical protein
LSLPRQFISSPTETTTMSDNTSGVPYSFAFEMLRAINKGADPKYYLHLLGRMHASVSADPPNGTKDRVASINCNKFDECIEHIGEVEYAGARFILFADRPDVGAEPEAPAVPLLFKDWVAPPDAGSFAFWRHSLFPYVQWGAYVGPAKSAGLVKVRTAYTKTPVAVRALAVLPKAQSEVLIRRLENETRQHDTQRTSLKETWRRHAEAIVRAAGVPL